MASIPSNLPPAAAAPSPPPGGRCVRIALPDRRPALSLLLTGRPEGGDAAVDHFLAYVHDQGLSLDDLWVVLDEGVPKAAALVLPTAGGAAMAFVSPVFDGRDEPWAAAVVGAAIEVPHVLSRRMIQALLDPPQRRERAVFAAAGFERLSELQYMQRGTDVPLSPLRLPAGFTVARWSEDRRAQFVHAVADSYVGTRDCPGLLGVRTLDEVIAGHMATGTFVPDLWHVVLRGEQPVGVMLLNLLPQRAMAELVYLGLAPDARGHGLARALLTHGIALVRDYGATSLVLAVDDDNAPALRLYRQLGFVRGVKKTAMIRRLNVAGTA